MSFLHIFRILNIPNYDQYSVDGPRNMKKPLQLVVSGKSLEF